MSVAAHPRRRRRSPAPGRLLALPTMLLPVAADPKIDQILMTIEKVSEDDEGEEEKRDGVG